jgi:predicted Zn-dependent protease
LNARILAIGALVGVVAVACTKAPYTKRPQLDLVPDSVMKSLGKSEYEKTLASSTVEKGGDDVTTLRTVGAKIAKVANRPDYDWQFNMIESNEVNGWCMPGGYIAFYTGILPVLENEAGMAFVMGHEVGHAVAHHGAERMTQQLAILGGMTGLSALLAAKTDLNRQQENTVLAAIGAGTTVGIVLPFSRTQEAEADTIGTMYMARAGYPPEQAVQIWDRMEKATGGSSTPSFLSDHPADAKRKEDIQSILPQARKKYQRNKLSYDTTAKKW